MKGTILPTLIKAVVARDNGKDYKIIAVDGPCATGKSTFADDVAKEYDCQVFHMDDFFLTEEEKTEERLSVPGGNVAWERFEEEVLKKLDAGQPFTYKKYNCKTGEFFDSKEVKPKKLYIVEGVYSHHPELVKYYDYRIFFDVTKKTQQDRLKKRNSEKMYQRFINEWIPLEDKYFDAFSIRAKSSFVFDTSRAF